MAAGLIVADGAAGSNKWGIDANQAGRVLIYDKDGNPAVLKSGSALPASSNLVSQGGMMLSAADY
jgi:hypothetical protein